MEKSSRTLEGPYVAQAMKDSLRPNDQRQRKIRGSSTVVPAT